MGEPGKLPVCFRPAARGHSIDSMSPFSALPTLPRLAAGALNALTGREPWARERLSRHAGKTARFALAGQTVSLTISTDGTVVSADDAIVPDVTLTLQSDKLRPDRLLGGKPDFAEVTHISGDAALAQAVADLARDLRWDAEGDLARVVGDIPATRLASGVRMLTSGLRNAGQRLAANMSEYLTEEQPVLAGKSLLDQWRQDQSALQTDTDALQRRIAELDARLARLAAKRGA
ncbi:Uncharacterized protein conserved in bacteria [Bordetella ansorpii]|jgi:ubiquinone biosynthesis protein UbiJ|uniref:Ubiquinone biosynthesis accessory factor UbiJ n=2 Tax=Bordetella ansorpii TaxID=288768 RepID=A0A157QT24_9BORD|nr:Uncharacterized protein conserved in bacteria [Bordetella ansorpii]